MANDVTTLEARDSVLTMQWAQACSLLCSTAELRDGHPLTTDERAALTAARAALSASLQPAPQPALVVVLRRLMNHYPASQRDPGLEKARWEDWLEDLAGIPLDAVEAAAKAWRRSPKAFAPTPGEILALAEPIVRGRFSLLRRVEALLNRPEPAPREAVTDEEHATLVSMLRNFTRGLRPIEGGKR